MRTLLTGLAVLLALSSCSAPPKPSTADESTRRPANAAAAVSLQVCESELHNLRIAQQQSSRATDAARAAVIRLASQQQSLAKQALRLQNQGNTIYTVLFTYGSTRVILKDEESRKLSDAAKDSVLIALRGRTDGAVASDAENRIARERSEAVRDYLIQAGIDPERIRTTWQPVGDNAADNSRDSGRRLNRRVEIELYRAAPRTASLETPEP